jgi:hypothetical protein
MRRSRLKNEATVLHGGPLDRTAAPKPQSLGTLPFTLRGQAGCYSSSYKGGQRGAMEWKS